MTRQSYRAIKKARRQRRKVLRTWLPAAAAASLFVVLFAVAVVALNDGADFSSEPTPTPQLFPGAKSITIVIEDVLQGNVIINSAPRSDPRPEHSTILYDLTVGDEITFLGRHPNEGWYLIKGNRPLWTYLNEHMLGLRATLSDLPLVTEEEAAARFGTPQPPTRPQSPGQQPQPSPRPPP